MAALAAFTVFKCLKYHEGVNYVIYMVFLKLETNIIELCDLCFFDNIGSWHETFNFFCVC